MPTEEQMTINERRKYVKRMKPRYQQARRAECSRLLTEMQEVTGLHRLLHASSLNRKKRTTPRKRSYGLYASTLNLRNHHSGLCLLPDARQHKAVPIPQLYAGSI